MAGTMPISGYGTGGYYSMKGYAPQGANGNISGIDGDAKKSANPDDQVKPGRRSSPSECKTCKSRKYQDGSNESDVSFKAPGHISPQASAGAVRSHEQEHVGNAYEKAVRRGGRVRSATVVLHTAVCPECGTSYVSGGETRTVISYPKDGGRRNPYLENKKSLDAIRNIGANIDYVA